MWCICTKWLKWRSNTELTEFNLFLRKTCDQPSLLSVFAHLLCHSPIQTSPNCPAPSLRSSFRDSRGISHSSCHHGFCGALDWHGFNSFVHKPSESPAWRQERGDRFKTIQMETPTVIGNVDESPHEAVRTWVMLDKLLQRVKGYLGCDVEATVVHVADSVVLDSFTTVVVQVPDW